MEKATLIQQVTALIQEADTETALQTLQAYLQSAPRYAKLHQTAVRIQANYQRIRQQQRTGLLSNEDADVALNKINAQILQLLDDLQAERLHPTLPATSGNTRNWRGLLLFGVLFLFLGTAAFFFFRKTDHTNPVTCPRFAPQAALKVLLLPFVDLSSGGQKPELVLQDGLQKKTRENQLNVSIQIFEQYFQQANAPTPNFENITRIGQDCDSELVVWGTVEKGREDIEVIANFKYLGEKDRFDLEKIQLEGEALLDTVPTISSLQREGTIISRLDAVINLLFGMMAHEEGAHEQAVRAFTQTDMPLDSNATTWANLLAADSYLRLGQNDSALLAYDKVLEASPNNVFALSNRAHLLYKKGDFEHAIEDFSNVLRQNPDAEPALYARGMAYMEAQDKQKALEDFDRIRRLSSSSKLKSWIQGLDQEVQQELQKEKIYTPKPVFFEEQSYQQFLLNESAALAKFPARPTKGYTIILGAHLQNGNTEQVHELQIPETATGKYLIEIRKKLTSRVSLEINGNSDRRRLQLATDRYESTLDAGLHVLRVSRPAERLDRYYEIRITYLEN